MREPLHSAALTPVSPFGIPRHYGRVAIVHRPVIATEHRDIAARRWWLGVQSHTIVT